MQTTRRMVIAGKNYRLLDGYCVQVQKELKYTVGYRWYNVKNPTTIQRVKDEAK